MGSEAVAGSPVSASATVAPGGALRRSFRRRRLSAAGIAAAGEGGAACEGVLRWNRKAPKSARPAGPATAVRGGGGGGGGAIQRRSIATSAATATWTRAVVEDGIPIYDKCLAYVNLVREVFKDDVQKFVEFRKVMQDSTAQRTSAADTFGEVKRIFEGHTRLICGFRSFLSEGFESTGGGRAEPVRPDSEHDAEAIAYWAVVQEELKDDQGKLTDFVEVLHEFRTGKIDAVEIVSRVTEIIKGLPALMLGFKPFIPEGSFKLTLPAKEEKTPLNQEMAISTRLLMFLDRL